MTARENPEIFVYLAGPEVFLKDAVAVGKQRKRVIRELCDAQDWPFRLVGLFPLDNEIPDFKPDRDTAMRIYRGNISLMDRAHAVAANMVRFRGPGMDNGTAFEMGYMRAAGKPVFGYYDAAPFYGSNETPGKYADRVAASCGLDQERPTVDSDGLAIEDFGLEDNLMMIGALEDSGSVLQAGFRDAINLIAEHFK